MNIDIVIVIADYHHQKHQNEIITLLNEYANDPMGGGEPLKPEVRDNLVQSLAKLPHALSLIAYHEGKAVGLANCFEGFSTFYCKPIINIHDLAVTKPLRGKGIGQHLLTKIEEIAKAKGCCKVTLEVLSENRVAKIAYEKFGFCGYELGDETGYAEFWQKLI